VQKAREPTLNIFGVDFDEQLVDPCASSNSAVFGPRKKAKAEESKKTLEPAPASKKSVDEDWDALLKCLIRKE
jgi:hypothetical protein